MLKVLAQAEWRLLTFRNPGRAITEQWRAFLLFGLLFTWLAGIGRYWDNPRAELWQLLGLGSLIYVLVLAAIIWLLLAPLRPNNWQYRNVLLFITLTSPPAILYAIPVERFVSADLARAANAWFLAIVAVWRVALLVWFLRQVAGLSRGAVLVGSLLPLCIIVIALTMLNLEHVVFNIMSGISENQRSPNDTAYTIVLVLSVLSFLLAPVLLAGYLYFVWQARREPARPANP